MSDVAVYNLADSLAGQVQYLPTAPLPAILAQASVAHESDDSTVLQTMTLDGSRFVAVLSCVIGGFIVGSGPILYRLWLGRVPAHLDEVTVLLVVTYLIVSFVSALRSVGQAMGQMKLIAQIGLWGSIGNIAATIALAIPFGLVGVLLGTICGVTIRSGVYFWRFGRILGLPIRILVVQWLWRALAATAGASALLRLFQWMASGSFSGSRLTSLIEVIVAGIVYVPLFFTLLRLVRFFDAHDLAVMSPRLS